MNIRAVFIDIDNTLLDFDEYVRCTMRDGFEHFGLCPFEPWMYDVFTVENNKLWRRIEDATLTFEELQTIRWNTVFKKLGIDFDGPKFERYFRDCLHESAIPVEGAEELLKALSGRYILCAASNGPYEQQLHRLDIAGMRDYFDYIFISEDLGVSKPAKEFFDAAFERMNKDRSDTIRPDECLMIGDSLSSDIAGGRNCGMKTCFYRRDKDMDVEKENLDITADSLADIPALIGRL